jgi:hypothetical protein
MMSGSSRPVAAWLLALLVALHVTLGAQETATPLSSESLKAAIAKAEAREKTPRAKLDPPLEAVARAWRRTGVKGAERECASRDIPLKDLRLDAVINLVTADRRGEVERALRKAWGQVTAASDETTLHVRLPVPAIRRMERLSAVHSIYLDSSVRPAGATPTK